MPEVSFLWITELSGTSAVITLLFPLYCLLVCILLRLTLPWFIKTVRGRKERNSQSLTSDKKVKNDLSWLIFSRDEESTIVLSIPWSQHSSNWLATNLMWPCQLWECARSAVWSVSRSPGAPSSDEGLVSALIPPSPGLATATTQLSRCWGNPPSVSRGTLFS